MHSDLMQNCVNILADNNFYATLETATRSLADSNVDYTAAISEFKSGAATYNNRLEIFA